MAKKIRRQLDTTSEQSLSALGGTATILSGPTRRGRGRPTEVTQKELIGRRDSLVSRLESSWGEIGWDLETARKIRDLVKSLSPLKAGYRAYPLEYFFEEAGTPSGRLEVRKTRRELWQISEEIRNLHDARQKQTELVTEAQTALSQAENKPEVVGIVRAELETRQAEFNRLESELKKAQARRQESERNLHNQEAFFAQTELLKFLRSRRYALTPRNLANAMAGLPYIGWRQSFKRCAGVPCRMATSLYYQIFQAIAYLLRHKRPRSAQDALRLFQAEVPKLPKKHELARKYLVENWQHLKEATENCWKIRSHPNVLPFRLTVAFEKSLNRPRTALDRLLAARERLEISKPNNP